MKSITFQIPLKPISTNASHKIKFAPRGRVFRGKKNETVAFERSMMAYMTVIRDAFKEFVKSYDRTQACIHVDAYFYVPIDDFFTKSKSKKNPRRHISRTSLDLDNCLKTAFDVMFRFMGIDDSNVAFINAQKIPTDGEWRMIFKLSIAPFPALNAFSADHLSHL